MLLPSLPMPDEINILLRERQAVAARDDLAQQAIRAQRQANHTPTARGRLAAALRALATRLDPSYACA